MRNKIVLHPLKNTPTNIKKICTLGPAYSTSHYTALILKEKFFVNIEIELFGSFEEAASKVLEEPSTLLLVPNAYNRISKFYFSRDLELTSYFLMPISPYGIATKPHHYLPQHTIAIYAHHATLSLIPDLLRNIHLGGYEILDCPSTSQAAIWVAQSKDVVFCIANELAVQHYGLKFVSPTKAIHMLWSCFLKNRDI